MGIHQTEVWLSQDKRGVFVRRWPCWKTTPNFSGGQIYRSSVRQVGCTTQSGRGWSNQWPWCWWNQILPRRCISPVSNANLRLNGWRQKRFAEYLTDVGKRIFKKDIPTDKHIFPDKFHQVVESSHDHSKTNSKVIAAPYKPSLQKDIAKKPFRAFSTPSNGGPRQWGKRKWLYKKSSQPNQRSEFGHSSTVRPPLC